MHRNARLVFIIFGLWSLLLFGIALANQGEIALSAHLWLVITGLPSALLSLHLQNGSTLAVGAAALLGLVQWLLLAQLDSWLTQRKKSKNG
jgi:hypothetical protein